MSLLRKSYEQCNNREDDEDLFGDRNRSWRPSAHHLALILLLLAGLTIIVIIFIIFSPHILSKGVGTLNEDLNHVAQTNCGSFVGVNEGGAIVFKGIPYAQPPIGQLRWRKPVPLWTNTSWCRSKNYFQAVEFGSSCFQLNPFLKKFEGHEDCLYLNVWTPSLDPGAELEVMVWIHGGFLQFGSGHQKGLSPTGLLAQKLNVVFVSFNYRLHVLGYLALETLFTNLIEDSRGNYGTWDQLLVMEWVRDNILFFGGDPNKVTIFGPDGGAASILTMMTSPYFRHTFRSAWLLGPAMVMNRSFSHSSSHNTAHFLEKSGCAQDMNCLRKLTPKELTGTYIWNDDPSFRIRDQNDIPIQGILPEQLLVVDGDILPLPPIELALHRRINDIPLLIGTAAQAVDFWPGPEDLYSWSWNQYSKYVTTSLNSFSPKVSQMTLQLYNRSHVYGENPTPELLYTTMVTDIRQTCPVNELTDVFATTMNNPIFRYVVTSRSSKPIHIYRYPGMYSCHLWDAIAFFDQIQEFVESPNSEDFMFRDTIQKTVVDFVKSSMSLNEWLRYPHSIALINSNISIEESYHNTNCKFWMSNGLRDYAWVS